MLRVVTAAGGLFGLALAACEQGGDGGGGLRPVPAVEANVASMDAIGDSISKGFNAVSEGEVCPESELERRNWSTGDTHGGDFCSDGGEGVFSHAERLECVQGRQIVRADPNAALSGARMLTEFADQSRAAAAFLAAQPEPRYVTVLLGQNDVCAGRVDRVQASCPNGADEDAENHCRTTPEAFERELRKGLDALIGVAALRIGVAALVRVSLLCAHGGKQPCVPGIGSCQDVWTGAVAISVPDERGICGSLTVDCSDARVASAYQIARAYRDVLESVAAEYAAVSAAGTSPVVTVGGESVGGATKAAGVEVVFSDAPWRGRFDAADVSCCDCFHPSVAGQDRLARVLMEGITCGDLDGCCTDTGDPVLDGRCAEEDRGGTFHAGFFPLASP
jgi:lysophospholipase L1-like esterase